MSGVPDDAGEAAAQRPPTIALATLREALDRTLPAPVAPRRSVGWGASPVPGHLLPAMLAAARAAGGLVEVLCADDACAAAWAKACAPLEVPVRAIAARLAPTLREAREHGFHGAANVTGVTDAFDVLRADFALAPPADLLCDAETVTASLLVAALNARAAVLHIVFERVTDLPRLPQGWWPMLAASPRVRLRAGTPAVAAATAAALELPVACVAVADDGSLVAAQPDGRTAASATTDTGTTPVSLRRRLLRGLYVRAVTHPLGSAIAERARQSRWVIGDTAVAPAIERLARSAAPVVKRTPDARLRVTHHIGSLGAGGSERQLVNLVAGSVARGCDVRVLTSVPISGGAGHFAPALRALGVVPEQVGARVPATVWAMLDAPPWAGMLAAVPRVMRTQVRALLGSLLLEPPDVLHGWLDLTNVWAGVAGLLADVPALVLATRSLNPSRFPALAHPWFRDWYRVLAQSARVHLTANSHVGGADYAAWMDVAPQRFEVILNGIDTPSLPRADDVTAARTRATIGVPADAPLLLGVLRLSDEKRPDLWLSTALAALRRLPHAHAVLVGDGPRAARLARRLARDAAHARVHLLGRRQDVPALMAASDVLLLTSRLEGLPNVLLEAQWAGCAVVTTAAGGAVDALDDGITGHVVRDARPPALAAAVVALLDDPARLAATRAHAPAFVARRFGLARMVDEYHALYVRALDAD